MSDPNDHDADHDAGRRRGLPPRERVPEEEPSAWRLTFEYDEEGVRLVGRQHVQMLAPPDDSPRTLHARAGYWVELREESGHGIYRQILADPMPSHQEAHSPLPGATPVQVPIPPGEVGGIFQVVVPDLPEAEDVVLHGIAGPGSAETLADRVQPSAVPLLTEALRPAQGEES